MSVECKNQNYVRTTGISCVVVENNLLDERQLD